MQHKESNAVKQTELDNDALTRLIYLHDDEITRLISYVQRLEGRVQELEQKIEK